MEVRQNSKIGNLAIKFFVLKNKIEKRQKEVDAMKAQLKKYFIKYDTNQFDIIIGKETLTIQKQDRTQINFDYLKLKDFLSNDLFERIVKPSIDNGKLNELIESGEINLKRIKKYSSYKESIALSTRYKEDDIRISK